MNERLERLSGVFAALANPNRLRMYQLLRERELACEAAEVESPAPERCCNVGELAAKLNISAATVSHHLKELNRAGLIETSRRGRFVYCAIDEDQVERLQDFLSRGRSAVGPS